MSLFNQNEFYGKDSDSIFLNWVKDGKLRYENKKKSDHWLQSRGLQLPKEVTNDHNQSLLHETDVVNPDNGKSYLVLQKGGSCSGLATAAIGYVESIEMALGIKKQSQFLNGTKVKKLPHFVTGWDIYSHGGRYPP